MEDLHWADASTMEFLTLFINQPPVPHLMSVFTVRTEFALPWSARSPVTQLTLPKLSDRDVRTMIENLSGEMQLPARRSLNKSCRKTDGIPVFVEELTRMVLELGLVTSDGAPDTSRAAFSTAARHSGNAAGFSACASRPAWVKRKKLRKLAPYWGACFHMICCWPPRSSRK